VVPGDVPDTLYGIFQMSYFCYGTSYQWTFFLAMYSYLILNSYLSVLFFLQVKWLNRQLSKLWPFVEEVHTSDFPMLFQLLETVVQISTVLHSSTEITYGFVVNIEDEAEI
jgi:hypothetical protein